MTNLSLIYKLRNRSSIFSETSCELTAAAIRWKLGFEKLRVLENDVTFSDVYKRYNFYQVSFGSEWMDINHILTVYDAHIIQSYYQKYTTESPKVDSYVIDNFDNHDYYTKSAQPENTLVFYWYF